MWTGIATAGTDTEPSFVSMAKPCCRFGAHAFVEIREKTGGIDDRGKGKCGLIAAVTRVLESSGRGRQKRWRPPLYDALAKSSASLQVGIVEKSQTRFGAPPPLSFARSVVRLAWNAQTRSARIPSLRLQ